MMDRSHRNADRSQHNATRISEGISITISISVYVPISYRLAARRYTPHRNRQLRPLLAQPPNVLVHAREDNTIKTHMSAYEQWKNWATAFSLAVIPADLMYVALFLLNRIQMGGKFSIIKNLFYGIKFVHKFKYLPDPTKHAVVNNMYEASKRLCPSTNGKKQPITAAHIGLLYSELFEKSAMSLTTLRTFVMFVLGFCGFEIFGDSAY